MPGQPVLINDVIEVKTFCWYANKQQLGINVLHYECTNSVGSGGTDQDAATAIDLMVKAPLAAMMTTDQQYYGTSVQILRIPPLIAATASTPTPGTNATPATPSQVSGIVTWKSYFAGRAFRGRSYIPFPAQAWNDPTTDKPTGAYVILLNAWASIINTFNAFGSGLNFSSVRQVIYHRATRTSTPIAGWQARQKWATQRRRGDYGRVNTLPF